MAHPMKHAESSARRFGGTARGLSCNPQLVRRIEILSHRLPPPRTPPSRRRYFLSGTHLRRHHRQQRWRAGPVRYVGEQHVKEDLGRIPPSKTGSRKSSLHGGCMDSASGRMIHPLRETLGVSFDFLVAGERAGAALPRRSANRAKSSISSLLRSGKSHPWVYRFPVCTT